MPASRLSSDYSLLLKRYVTLHRRRYKGTTYTHTHAHMTNVQLSLSTAVQSWSPAALSRRSRGRTMNRRSVVCLMLMLISSSTRLDGHYLSSSTTTTTTTTTAARHTVKPKEQQLDDMLSSLEAAFQFMTTEAAHLNLDTIIGTRMVEGICVPLDIINDFLSFLYFAPGPQAEEITGVNPRRGKTTRTFCRLQYYTRSTEVFKPQNTSNFSLLASGNTRILVLYFGLWASVISLSYPCYNSSGGQRGTKDHKDLIHRRTPMFTV